MLTNLSRDAARLLWKWTSISVAASAVALSVASIDTNSAVAKTPGSTYCFYGTCHRVKTLAEMQSLVGTKSVMQASFYDSCKVDPLNPCGLTSSGEAFHPDRSDNAASPIYPDGTKVLVWSPETKESAVLRVNNAGPYWGPRTLDVSRAAAENLGFKPQGVGELEVRVLYAPAPHEATYRHEREYDPVPGHLGQFETIDAAEQAAKAVMAFQTALTAVMSPLASYRPAAPRNDPADDLAAPSIGAMVADASEPATRRRYAAVAPDAKTKAIDQSTVGPKKYTSHIVLAGTAKPAKSVKHAKRTTVASRKPPKATQVARAAPLKAKAQVAALVRPAFRADSAQDITAAGFRGPVTASRAPTARRLTAAYDMQRNTLAKKQPAKRLAAAPVRPAATGEGKSGKRLSGLPGKGRLKVSDARDVLLPAQPPLTGNRLREQIPGLVRDKIIRPRGVPAGPTITLA